MKMFAALATSTALTIPAMAAGPDVLGLLMLQDGAAETANAVPADKSAPSDLYFKGDVGLNLLQDVKMRDTLLDQAPRIGFRPGIDANIGFGIDLAKTQKATHIERFSMEFTAGFIWNEIDGVTSNTEEFDPLGPFFPLGLYSYGGGEGRMLQIPLNVDFVWTAYETKRLSVALNAGIGVQWTDLDLKNADFTTYDLVGNPTGVTQFSAKGNAVGFHYQAGIDVLFALTSSIELGGYFRYSGTPASSMGKITGTSVPFGELKIGELNNFSVGARMTVSF
ncbi:MAG: hypothetical protein CMJ23_03250 [Phycisphaerae bacterium]|nr:hypothetical protein [Phycisphaerae bacterium]